MGIEPTDHNSRRSPTGFEDQARHQTGSTSRRKIIPFQRSFFLGLVLASSLYSHPPRMKIIANPRAGHKRGLRAIKELRLLLRAKGVPHELLETEYQGHATELARRLVEKGQTRIIIFGGDGTISEVVNAVVNSKVELGVISVGTGNDLARTLGLPYNKPEQALEVIRAGKPVQVDVGWEQDRCFISTLGVGFPAIIAHEVNKMRNLKGSPAFFIATYKAMTRLRSFPARIELDKATLNVTCTSILIQNTRFCGGGLLMAPEARVDDGLFDVVVVSDIGKVDLMLNFPKIYRGRHLKHPKFSLYRSRSVRIDTAANLSKMFDGDIYGKTPVNAKVLRGAVTIISPPDHENE